MKSIADLHHLNDRARGFVGQFRLKESVVKVRIEFVAFVRFDLDQIVSREDLLHSFFRHRQTLMQIGEILGQNFHVRGDFFRRVRQGHVQNVRHFQQIFAKTLNAEHFRVVHHLVETNTRVLRFGQGAFVPILKDKCVQNNARTIGVTLNSFASSVNFAFCSSSCLTSTSGFCSAAAAGGFSGDFGASWADVFVDRQRNPLDRRDARRNADEETRPVRLNA